MTPAEAGSLAGLGIDSVMRAAGQSAGGFTLMELLLVAGIVAVLASLLFPAVGVVVDKARQARCMANLRQILVAANAYASEHGDRLPNIEPFPGSADPVYPKEAGFGGILDTLEPYGVSEKLLRCPADLAGPDFFSLEGTSYEWIPLFDHELRSNLRLLIEGTVVVVPASHAGIVSDWMDVHQGGRNVGFVDGHVEYKLSPMQGR